MIGQSIASLAWRDLAQQHNMRRGDKELNLDLDQIGPDGRHRNDQPVGTTPSSTAADNAMAATRS